MFLIKECKALIAAIGCNLKHSLQEGNMVADRLANIGADKKDKMVSHITPLD